MPGPIHSFDPNDQNIDRTKYGSVGPSCSLTGSEWGFLTLNVNCVI